MSNQSLFFSVNSKRLSEAEAAKAKTAFEKISNFSMEALSDIHPSIQFDLSMTDLPQGPQSSKEEAKEKQIFYQQGVNETHFFYLSTLFFLFLLLGAITLAEQLHESQPQEIKEQIASVLEKGNVFLAATMENGRVALGAIGEAALISFAAVKVKVLEAVEAVA